MTQLKLTNMETISIECELASMINFEHIMIDEVAIKKANE